eukprot:168240_1
MFKLITLYQQCPTHVEYIIDQSLILIIGILINSDFVSPSISYIIKKEGFDMLCNLCTGDNENYMPYFVNYLLTNFSVIWSITTYEEYINCPRSELPPIDRNYIFDGLANCEYINYRNSKHKYFRYLMKASYLLQSMIHIMANADSSNDADTQFVEACELINENTDKILKWVSFVFGILKVELLSTNNHLCAFEITHIYG